MWRVLPIRKSVGLLILLGSAAAISAQVEGRVPERRKADVQQRIESPAERLSPTEKAKLTRKSLGLSPDIGGDREAARGRIQIGAAQKTVRDNEKAQNAVPANQIAEKAVREQQKLRQTVKAARPSTSLRESASQSAGNASFSSVVEDFEAKEGTLSKDRLLEIAMQYYSNLSTESKSQVADKASEWLAGLGFAQRNQSREEVLRQYQQFRAIPATGSIDPTTASAISQDRRLLADAKFARFAFWLGTTQELLLRHSCSDCFGLLNDGTQRYLLVRPDAPELWTIDNNDVVVGRLEGANAIEEFHKTGRRIATEKSGNDGVFLYAAPRTVDPDSPIDFQIGSQVVSLTRAELQSFLQSSTAPAQLERALDSAKTTIVVLQEGTFTTLNGAGRLPGAMDVSATALATALKTRAGTTRDYLVATDPQTAIEHQRKLLSLPIKTSSDLTVYAAKTVTDYEVVNNLKKTLEKAGIRVVNEQTGYLPVPGTRTCLING